jgi:hypothetical protein
MNCFTSDLIHLGLECRLLTFDELLHTSRYNKRITACKEAHACTLMRTCLGAGSGISLCYFKWVPLVELEEYIKQKQAEKETLQHEIDEARVIIDSVNVDRQTIEEYKDLKSEMDKYHLEDLKKILNVLRALKKYKYDDKRIVAEFSNRRSMKKERLEIEFDRRKLEGRIRNVKDVLPLAEQLIQFRIGIGEVLAFHSAVFEKAHVEKIPLDAKAYGIAQDIRDYRQLAGLKKEHYRVQQQIYMFNAFMANKQATLMSLIRLQNMGISEDQILNMDQFLQRYNGQQYIRQ